MYVIIVTIILLLGVIITFIITAKEYPYDGDH